MTWMMGKVDNLIIMYEFEKKRRHRKKSFLKEDYEKIRRGKQQSPRKGRKFTKRTTNEKVIKEKYIKMQIRRFGKNKTLKHQYQIN
jgi:hypothetical protein